MKLSIRELELHERDASPGSREAVLRARIRLEDGREAEGTAAEPMLPGWFDPALGDEEGLEQLRASVHLAREAYLAAGEQSAFDHSLQAYGPALALGAVRGFTNLVAGFGPALADRAILDALCRALDISLFEAIRRNLPGIAPPGWQPDFAGFDMTGFLARLAPREHLVIRRTLEAGHMPARIEGRWFKVLLRHDRLESVARLCDIAEALDRRDRPYEITLDANEQFSQAEEALEFWRALKSERRLARFVPRVAFLASPIRRARASEVDVGVLAEEVPVVLDAADDSLDAFARARRLGYTGVTARMAKGIYKALLNAARCALWNGEEGASRYFVCGESLGRPSSLALQQHLALAALLGAEHVECAGEAVAEAASSLGIRVS